MNISQSAIAQLYLYALLLGVLLATVYDVLRITRVFLGVRYSRRTVKKLQEIRLPFLKPYQRRGESRLLGIVVFLEDLLFCIFSAVALILLFYQANNGRLRFPAILLVGVGFLLYRGTLGRLLMLFSEVIAFFVEVFFRYLVFFTTLPFRFLVRLICKRIHALASKAARVQKRSVRNRYTKEQLQRLQRDACGLIPEIKPDQRRPKRGKYIAKRKKTVQSYSACENSVGTSRRRVDRSVRQ